MSDTSRVKILIVDDLPEKLLVYKVVLEHFDDLTHRRQMDIARALKVDVEEIQKCVLLCANCHRETHASSSVRGKPRLNNRVNSGKPNPRKR